MKYKIVTKHLTDYNPNIELVNSQTKIALKMQKKLAKKEDKLIRKALISNGFNPDNKDFIRDNFKLIDEGDKFVHYYFHYQMPDEKRIISIEKNNNIDFENNFGNTLTMTISLKYY